VGVTRMGVTVPAAVPAGLLRAWFDERGGRPGEVSERLVTVLTKHE
jgi:hypothetical protein